MSSARISTYGSQTYLLQQMMDLRSRQTDEQAQVNTGFKSQTYAGIAPEANRLLGLGTEHTATQAYIASNVIVGTKVTAMQTATDSVRTAVTEFRNKLQTYRSAENPTDPTTVNQVQQWAFNAMKSVESALSASDGHYLFGGGKSSTVPIAVPYSTLQQFQGAYDGTSVTYPTTRDAALSAQTVTQTDTGALTFDPTAGTITAANVDSLSKFPVGSRIQVKGSDSNDSYYTVSANDGTSLTVTQKVLTDEVAATPVITVPVAGDPTALSLDVNATGGLTFDRAANTITATNGAPSLASIPVGRAFTISGTTSNNGTYTVTANTGGVITVTPKALTAEAPISGVTLSTQGYYHGDNIVLDRRIDTNQSVNLDANASSAGFEKALRALGMIAQGATGTAGGLDQNQTRVNNALWLLADAIDGTTSGTPPFGTEKTGSIDTVKVQLDTVQYNIQNASDRQTAYSSFLLQNMSTITQIDPAEAITNLTNDNTTLQAAYQAFAKIRSLSLADYIK